MAMSNIVDYIWNNVLEEAGHENAEPRWLRQLNCGCIVLRHDSYLDLYVWTSGGRACAENYGHALVNLFNYTADAEMESGKRKEFMTLVRRYTDGWGEQDDILTALAAL